MEDIAPGLLNRIRASFKRNIEGNSKISKLYQAIKDGSATYIDAEEYAVEVGTALADAFGANLSSAVLPDGKMHFNIADRVIRPLLEDDHEMISDAAAQVQSALNKNAGISLKVQKPEVNQDRIDGIIDRVSDEDLFDDISWMLDEPVINFSQSVVADYLEANVDFHGKSGLQPKIIRRSERTCCEWCDQLDGEYLYPDVPQEVYQRHQRCRCTVDYDPRNGKIQNVHTKGWINKKDYDKMIARRDIGIKEAFVKSIAKAPGRLASFTPKSLKEKLEAEGYEVKALQKGSLKGLSFEEGGGYKVNFGDGGLLQYHPNTKSHHGGAYYKISRGEGGTHRYDLEGNEIDG